MKKNSLLIILFLFFFQSYGQVLNVNYLFNGNADDSSVNGYHGTINGATFTTDRNGNSGTAIYFNGTNNYVSVGTWPFLTSNNFLNNFSLSFWIKTDYSGLSQESMVFGSINQAALGQDFAVILNGTYQNTWSPGSLYFYLRDENGVNYSYTVSASDLYDNNWHCVTFVMRNLSNHDATAYIDGVQRSYILNETQYPSYWVSFNNPFVIGALNNRGTISSFFRGGLDEFRIYDYDLSASQVLSNCNGNVVGNEELIDFFSTVSLYPSPSKDFLNISVNKPGIEYMSIYSSLGKLVYQGQVINKLDISHYSSGIYFIRFKDDNRIISKKFIVN